MNADGGANNELFEDLDKDGGDALLAAFQVPGPTEGVFLGLCFSGDVLIFFLALLDYKAFSWRYFSFLKHLIILQQELYL